VVEDLNSDCPVSVGHDDGPRAGRISHTVVEAGRV
jgi:hypothetical protein